MSQVDADLTVQAVRNSSGIMISSKDSSKWRRQGWHGPARCQRFLAGGRLQLSGTALRLPMRSTSGGVRSPGDRRQAGLACSRPRP